MNCETVRDLLPEHALGVAGGDATAVDRHLAWCAACRREARDLQGAASTLAFALAPTSPRDGLADEVVGSIHAAAGSPRRARSARRATTLLLAAAVALAGLLGGAAIARRQPSDDPTLAASRQAAESDALADFLNVALANEGTVASMGVLRAGPSQPGGGTAVSVVAPNTVDEVLIVISGLPADASLPYRVELADGEGRFAPVGTARVLDSGGGFTLATVTARDLTRFVNVLVRDASGDVVMRGTLREELPRVGPEPVVSRLTPVRSA